MPEFDFLETPRFPEDISYNSQGGPAFRTTVSVSGSGQEYRNTEWENELSRFQVEYGVKTTAQMRSLLALFRVVKGRAVGFRYKDFMDFRSNENNAAVSDTDQVIGTGDNIKTEFKLFKVYDIGGIINYIREISKPVIGTTIVAINGISQVSGWTVDTTTGTLTFDIAPTSAAIISVGYEFDVPCRFDIDEILAANIFHDYWDVSLPLVEIRP